jgi:hypothetical protein
VEKLENARGFWKYAITAIASLKNVFRSSSELKIEKREFKTGEICKFCNF